MTANPIFQSLSWDMSKGKRFFSRIHHLPRIDLTTGHISVSFLSMLWRLCNPPSASLPLTKTSSSLTIWYFPISSKAVSIAFLTDSANSSSRTGLSSYSSSEWSYSRSS